MNFAGIFRSLTLPLLIGLLTVCMPLSGQWSSDPSVNTPVISLSGRTGLRSMIPDGSGGVFLAWVDHHNPAGNVELQRVDSAGRLRWDKNGVPVSGVMGDRRLAGMASDGSNGLIVAWDEARGSPDFDIYAQRFDAIGTPIWKKGGVPLVKLKGNQTGPVVLEDGSGGAIVVWSDNRSGTADQPRSAVYAQRVNRRGAALWPPNGVLLAVSAGAEVGPVAAPDGRGGIVVCWQDRRSGSDEIYAQRLSTRGSRRWGKGGIRVSAARNQTFPAIAADGNGGAVIAWEDHSVIGNGNIFAQRIDSTGAKQWAAAGIPVCTSPSNQIHPVARPAGDGGAYIAWTDFRYPKSRVYIQRLTAGGGNAWLTNGLPPSTSAEPQGDPALLPLAPAGLVVAWTEIRNGDRDIMMQRLDPSGGEPIWDENGTSVSEAQEDQTSAVIVPDGRNGVIAAWNDERHKVAGETGIYVQRVDSAGKLH